MQFTIKIKSKSNSIYANFTAIYLDKETQKVQHQREGQSPTEIIIKENDEISVNTEAISNKLESDKIYLVTGILSMLCGNPNMGALLSITKAHHQIVPL